MNSVVDDVLRRVGSPPEKLAICSIGELAARVDAAPPPKFVVSGLIAEDSYGVFGAPKKVGKTWAICDLAVSVASGTPWLGHFRIDYQGPVLAFLGEGGERKMLRRLRAVARSRGLPLEDLPIRLSMRAPHLNDSAVLDEIRRELSTHPARLVIVDPFYLAAHGANAAQLNEMGALLEQLQHLAQDQGAALLVVHHHNKTGSGTGSSRFSGAGTAEWGRVLFSGRVTETRFEPGGRSVAVLEIEVEGDEVAEQMITIQRTVWAEDPEDLASAMHYEIEVLDNKTDNKSRGYTPSHAQVLSVLRDADDWLTTAEIVDRLTGHPKPLKKRTVQLALEKLNGKLHVERNGSESKGTTYSWRIRRPSTETNEAIT